MYSVSPHHIPSYVSLFYCYILWYDVIKFAILWQILKIPDIHLKQKIKPYPFCICHDQDISTMLPNQSEVIVWSFTVHKNHW